MDHPRVCGENHDQLTSQAGEKGSPPRMRGERHHIGVGGGQLRITPAYAGRTVLPKDPLMTWEDHPRVCGENPLAVLPREVVNG